MRTKAERQRLEEKVIECKESCNVDLCWLKLIGNQLDALRKQLEGVTGQLEASRALFMQIQNNVSLCPMAEEDDNSGTGQA
jgi:hypothetical protein